NETRLYGTKGGLRFHHYSWDSNEVEFFSVENNQLQKETFMIDTSAEPDDSQAVTTHFLDYLDGKVEPLMTVQRAAKHMEILFKIIES
ncbi:MAG: hypothetical protein J0M11_20595, partial [Anaerolineae bacterium]|nr:hypothetical protein [Anaerolineae bacterium]